MRRNSPLPRSSLKPPLSISACLVAAWAPMGSSIPGSSPGSASVIGHLAVGAVQALPFIEVEGLRPAYGVDAGAKHRLAATLEVVVEGVGNGVAELFPALLEDGAGEVEEGIVGECRPRSGAQHQQRRVDLG